MVDIEQGTGAQLTVTSLLVSMEAEIGARAASMSSRGWDLVLNCTMWGATELEG